MNYSLTLTVDDSIIVWSHNTHSAPARHKFIGNWSSASLSVGIFGGCASMCNALQYFSMPLTFLQECEDSTGIHQNLLEWDRNPQEWDILNKIAYIYVCLYLLNSLHIYKCLYFYICIYWSAFIYLNYYLLPFNIMNLQGLEMHGDMSRAS